METFSAVKSTEKERTELETSLVNNYSSYIQEDRTRNERGKLTSPVAELFELRMNRNLEDLKDVYRALGGSALAPEDDPETTSGDWEQEPQDVRASE